MNKDKISKIIDEISKNFAELSNNCNDDIDAAAHLIIQSIQSGGKVMFCGNESLTIENTRQQNKHTCSNGARPGPGASCWWHKRNAGGCPSAWPGANGR